MSNSKPGFGRVLLGIAGCFAFIFIAAKLDGGTSKPPKTTETPKDKTVENAYVLCSVIDGTKMVSAPCEVSGWEQAVIATVDMTSNEARALCPMIAGVMREKGLSFSSNWKIQIRSPYSGENSIAFCDL